MSITTTGLSTFSTEVWLFRVQTDPNASAQPTATAYFATTTTINGESFQSPNLTSVTWPLLETGKSVTLMDGTTLTYAQVSEGVTTIAYQERALMDAPPPDLTQSGIASGSSGL